MLEVLPAMVIVAAVVFAGLLDDANDNRITFKLDAPYLREVTRQRVEDPASLIKAAEVLNAAGYPYVARGVLQTAERLVVQRMATQPIPAELSHLPASVGDALDFEQRNEASRDKLRRLALRQLLQGVLDQSYSDGGTAGIVPVAVRNASRATLLETTMRFDTNRTLGGRNLQLRCTMGEPREGETPPPFFPGDSRIVQCRPPEHTDPQALRRELHGGHPPIWAIVERVEFADPRLSMDYDEGVHVPRNWPDTRYGGAPRPIDLQGQYVDCRARGMCVEEAVLGIAPEFERWSLALLFVLPLMLGLCSGAVTRRLFSERTVFRSAGIKLSLALAVLALAATLVLAAQGGGYAAFVFIAFGQMAVVAYAGWLVGFWTHAAVFFRYQAA